MQLYEVAKAAIKALTANKARSLLTMLGVIIGVFAVVMLIALGQGIKNYVVDEFNELGSNLVFIAPGRTNFAGDPGAQLTRNPLDQSHIDLINKYASEHVLNASPYLISGETVEYKSNNFFAEITGISANSVDVINYNIDVGRSFNNVEERNSSKVAVLGPEVATELFGSQSPIGKKIKVSDDNYEVIGTFLPKGSNYDDQILVPYTSAEQTFDIKNYSSIFAKVDDAENVDIAVKQIEAALLRDLEDTEFSVLSQADVLDSINEVLGVLTLALGGIAGISLVVGGVGIMNIMLVSVNERIREIGLRKAIGATPRIIGTQFLIESASISVLGGIIGLAFGFLGTFVAQQFLRASVPAYAVFLALGFSVMVGVLFGTYPAIKASKLDPIEALRYE